MAEAAPAPDSAAAGSGSVRHFGRYALVRLLGKSALTMAWLATWQGRHVALVMPRKPVAADGDTTSWLQRASRAARLQHPRLAPVLEHGLHEHWPFVAYAMPEGRLQTLAETLRAEPLAPLAVAKLFCESAQGLAYAHESGVAHHDVQAHLLLVDEAGLPLWLGLEAALAPALQEGGVDIEIGSLRGHRLAQTRDVLALGLLLHWGLAGSPVLDEPDTSVAIALMPPKGRDIVRLPWSLPRPVPDALRSMANRASDRQERQRYQTARTLARALEGYLQVQDGRAGGALALLEERLQSVGALPASPGGAQRVARLALMEGERTFELAEVALGDVALSFELVRCANTQMRVRPGAASGDSVLTVRRSIAMLGLNGLRRAAQSLRDWPGPLDEAGAAALLHLLQQSKRAARLAQLLRPRGYDAEVIYLVALLQNLGRLVVQYHFPEESMQIRRLMRPQPALEPGSRAEPGMSEDVAACAVLGTDIETLGQTVIRYWGLDEAVLPMLRRQPGETPPRAPSSDSDHLRLTASCAHEALEASVLPAEQASAALLRVSQRYARVLGVSLRELQAALQEASSQTSGDATLAMVQRLSAFGSLDEEEHRAQAA
jgi:non-specific serine/threonine protein kinase